MEKHKLTEEEIERASLNDPVAIEYRNRIAELQRVMGLTYADRVVKEYQSYINDKYGK